MTRLPSYTLQDTQELAELIDDLREDGCPEEELLETAQGMLAELRDGTYPDWRDDPDDNPFWEQAEYDPERDEPAPEQDCVRCPFPCPTRCSIV